MTGRPGSRDASPRPAPGDDRGSATVLLVGVIAVAVTVLVAALAGAAHRTALVRASGAADAGALAGAAAAVGLVPGVPCVVVRRVITANGAEAGTCHVDGARVTVTARVATRPFAASATATAGPLRTSDVYKERHRSRGAPARCVYGVLVGPLVIDAPVDLDAERARRPTRTIDQGVTCQARRSS